MSGFFVVSGTALAVDAVLGVTQITAVKTFATADGTYTNGWSWIFDVTVPTNETTLKMKFADWVSGSNTITAADHIRFYSAQSSNASDAVHAISISATNNYSGEMNLIPASDLNLAQTGRQIQITIEAMVPTGSAGGSYSTSYGIQSNPDTTAPVIILTGDNPQTIQGGSTYTELGATATDNVDITVTVTPDASAVHTDTVGSYTVNYNAVDSAGNLATATRTVNVVDAAAQVAAERAVSDYEAVPIATLTEVVIAESLKAPADTAAALVLDPTAKTVFVTRISTRTNAIASARTTLEAEAAAALALANATNAVVLAETTPTWANLATAQTLIRALPSGAAKTALINRFNAVRAILGVTLQIDELPAVSDLTLADAEMVTAARNAYDALTVSQQALVPNLATLQAAEAQIAVVLAETTPTWANLATAQTLIRALPSGAAKTALINRFNAVRAILGVTLQIDELPAVSDLTLADAEMVTAARNAYDALTVSQQALVPNLATLQAAEAQITILQG